MAETTAIYFSFKLVLKEINILFSKQIRPLSLFHEIDGFWFGIGIIEKNKENFECREEAKQLALSEIASQISVDVSASFERMVIENNLSLSDFSKSITKIHVEKKDLKLIEKIISLQQFLKHQ